MHDDGMTGLISEARKIAELADQTFGGLSARQLNWQPSEAQWSVGLCLAHLLTTNASYFPALERISKGEQQKTFWERLPLLPNVFGKMTLKAVAPESVRKYKAPEVFRPASSDVNARVVTSFVAQHRELIGLMQATAHHDPRRLVITSPVSRFVTYTLLDCYAIIVTHERRHFKQAESVMTSAGFPAS
ncbi:MAG: DinB family protein [Pyrinomonadaceae bacterium]